MKVQKMVSIESEDFEYCKVHGGLSACIRDLITRARAREGENIGGILDEVEKEKKTIEGLDKDKKRDVTERAYKRASEAYVPHLWNKYPTLRLKWVRACTEVAEELGYL